MNQLPTDTFIYLMDLMMLPPSEYLTLFQINKHWRQMTDLNFFFWERQLGGLFHIFYELQTMSKSVSQCAFFKLYFFDEKKMIDFVRTNTIINSIVKTGFRSGLLDIIKAKHEQSQFTTENLTFMKTLFIHVYKTIRNKENNYNTRIAIGIQDSHSFDYGGLRKYNYFYEDIIDNLKRLMHDSTCMSNFFMFWRHLLVLDLPDQQSVTKLQNLFIDKCVSSKQNVKRRILRMLQVSFDVVRASLPGSNTYINSQNNIDLLVDRLLFFEETKGLSLDSFKSIVCEIFLDSFNYSNQSDVIYILEKLRTRFKAIYKKYVDVNMVLSFDVKRLNPKDSDSLLLLMEYLLNHYRMDGIVVEKLFFHCDKYKSALMYYESKFAKPIIIGTINSESIYAQDFVQVLKLLHQIYSVYLQHGKTDKVFIRELFETNPFKLEIVANSSDMERLNCTLNALFDLFAPVVSKQKIMKKIKQAYLQCLYLPEMQQLTELYMTNFQLKPSNCSLTLDANKISDLLSTYGVLDFQNIHSASEKFKRLTKQQRIPKDVTIHMHPIAYFILTEREMRYSTEVFQLTHTPFFLQFGNDLVKIPVLFDALKDVPPDINNEDVFIDRDCRVWFKTVPLKYLLSDRFYGLA